MCVYAAVSFWKSAFDAKHTTSATESTCSLSVALSHTAAALPPEPEQRAFCESISGYPNNASNTTHTSQPQ